MIETTDRIPMALSKPGLQKTERLKLVILTLVACLGIFYLVPKVLSISFFHVGSPDYFDFQLIWHAGQVWASGQNPYDGAAFYGTSFGSSAPSSWFYPPYWYPLIVPFGLLSFHSALAVWKIANFLLLIVSTHLIARALADVTHQKYLPIFLSGICFISFMYATAVTVWSGQTSILVYFGLSALIFGLLKMRPAMMIVGLAFLALKPQFGVLAFVAVAALPGFRWVVFPAGAICLLGSFAIALTADYRASIEGFFLNLTRHSEHAANTPPHLTGAIHIADYFFQISNVTLITIVVFVSAVICIAILFRKFPLDNATEPKSADHGIAILGVFIAFSLFVIPFHYYDMVALTVLFMMIVATPLAGRWLIGLGLLLTYRPDFIWRAFGVANPEEILLSHLVSSGLVLIVVGAAWSLWAHAAANQFGQNQTVTR